AIKKRYDDEAKKLDAEVKRRKEEGKTLDADAKKAKADADRLAAEIAKLEKAGDAADEVAAKRAELDRLKEIVARNERAKAEVAELEKRAKLLPEIGRRLLQAEIRLLPPGPFAKVTNPIGSAESRVMRLPGETEPVTVPADRDPREVVVDRMRTPDHPYFARAIVNRVWAHYFGRGIIDPPDNLSAF